MNPELIPPALNFEAWWGHFMQKSTHGHVELSDTAISMYDNSQQLIFEAPVSDSLKVKFIPGALRVKYKNKIYSILMYDPELANAKTRKVALLGGAFSAVPVVDALQVMDSQQNSLKTIRDFLNTRGVKTRGNITFKSNMKFLKVSAIVYTLVMAVLALIFIILRAKHKI